MASETRTTDTVIAHVRQDESGRWLTHCLQAHLEGSAALAESFASEFGAADWARAVGLWHDLGKYKQDFQTYIRQSSGYNTQAHLENIPGKVDHSTAGAILACEKHKGIGKIISYVVAGHHSGLPDWFKAEANGRGLSDRVRDLFHLVEVRATNPPADLLNALLPETLPPNAPEHAHLWIRMLFSCLVDADFLDTEGFMDPEKSELRGGALELTVLNDQFRHFMSLRDNAVRDTGDWDLPVNEARRVVLQDCLDAAEQSPGFFTLTVPTGGGKTLSSVAFALKHALKFNKRRVIVAIPYTSIIEQTAEVLSKVFGTEAILEHHSNLDPDRETPQGRLAAENWDAPVVVTTNVQLFESLFGARTSACRKLHNVVNSVIILDEAQMLPPELLMPTLSVLKGLVDHFGCTIVMCTATQPALIGEIGSGLSRFQGLSGAREIIRDTSSLFQQLKRVAVKIHESPKVDWTELAVELTRHQQVLCIVNRRRDCRELFEALRANCQEEPVHLSALMCGEHRSQVIARIKKVLTEQRPIRVVSTQLVEAGVDIDFPVVYRAMAGLDSIAQAAGRCNREGRLNGHGQLGRVVVFKPPKASPKGLLLKGEQCCAETLRVMPDECCNLSLEAFDAYFRRFFGSVNDHGRRDFEAHLVRDSSLCQFQFASAAKWYKLIDDGDSRGVVVWFKGNNFASQEVVEELRRFGPNRRRMRRLQRCTVNVPMRGFQNLREQGAIEEIVGPEGPSDIWAQSVPKLYDPTFGLRLEGSSLDGTEFIC
jgi:CRISPR-associated endonuclease/helicase Cas3